MIQRAILCWSQQCSASGARWLASITMTEANRQCGRTLAAGARGRRWSARFKAFKRRVQSRGCGAHPQRASASKAKSAVLSQLSGLENVVFNDFIDEELDSEDVSEQRASASLPDSVPIESEEERAAREADEMAALDAVGDYEADPNVMLEDVPQDIVIKTLKVSCACVPVLVFACVCVYVRARDVDMCS